MRMAPLPPDDHLDVDDFDHGDILDDNDRHHPEAELPLHEGMEEMKQPNRT